MLGKKYPLLRAEQAFLNLPPEEYSTYEKAKVVIIPFGLEASVSYKGGTKNGPEAMINASSEVELFDEEFWLEPYKNLNIVTLKEPKITQDVKTELENLEKITSDVLNDGKFPFIFGGEHSIVAGSIRPFVKKYPDLAILHFDAHADLRDGYDGEHFSHAAALRRCMDHENVSLVSCGIRNISASEIPFFEANKDRLKIYFAKDKEEWKIDEIVSHLKGKNVYLTFDVDGFDASLMPATGTPEPGGLFWNDAIKIIRAASKVSNIVGADINELAPISGLHSCDFLAAKLAYKILSLISQNGINR